jgi:hypothetical protein
VRILLVTALYATPSVALARGEIAVVAWEDAAATGGEAFTAGEAAIGIATANPAGRVVIRLDGVADRAKACRDAVCLAQLGAERGAEFVLAVVVHRARANQPMTAKFRLVLVREPVEQSQEVAAAECDVGVAPQDWRPLMEPTLAPILAPIERLPTATGRLLVTANVSDAEVLVDGTFQGRTPMPVLPAIPVGRHEVTVRAPRHEDFTASVEILEDGESRVDATLERIPEDTRPFYAMPIAWIIAGGVLVAGGAAGFLLLGGDEEPPPAHALVPPLR